MTSIAIVFKKAHMYNNVYRSCFVQDLVHLCDESTEKSKNIVFFQMLNLYLYHT